MPLPYFKRSAGESSVSVCFSPWDLTPGFVPGWQGLNHFNISLPGPQIIRIVPGEARNDTGVSGRQLPPNLNF